MSMRARAVQAGHAKAANPTPKIFNPRTCTLPSAGPRPAIPHAAVQRRSNRNLAHLHDIHPLNPAGPPHRARPNAQA
eukprot:365175-Chlamydomonas_euryale.AAC.6